MPVRTGAEKSGKWLVAVVNYIRKETITMMVECPHCAEIFELLDGHDVDAEFQCPNCNELIQPDGLPTVEAEDCGYCSREDSGVEYEREMTWKNGAWICDQCGRAQ